MQASEASTPLPRNPHLYEINTRVWLNGLSRRLGRRVTLGTVPRELWEELKALGTDLVWLMGVWMPSGASRSIAASLPFLRDEYRAVLPDFTDEDIVGSAYSVAGYRLNPALGDEEDLDRVRDAIHAAGMKVVLDFVPNHTSIDHEWTSSHPERYVGSDDPSLFGPGEVFPVRGDDGLERWIAHGRDPNFPPWTDTAQLNAFSSETRRAVSEELLRLGQWCDGLRCDMAMLMLNRQFANTWQRWLGAGGIVPETEFWTAVLTPLKQRFPEFVLIAEEYWGCDEQLLNLGFDYTYDKEGYDHLRSGDIPGLKRHLSAEGPRSGSRIRFLENHDEDRMAAAFPEGAWRSAAVIHGTTPGMRLFHDGQLEGKTVRVPVQLGRGPQERGNREIADFYRRLLAIVGDPLLKEGEGTVLEISSAWEGDSGYRSLLAFGYRHGPRRAIVAVNHGTSTASGYVHFPPGFLPGGTGCLLADKLASTDSLYERETGEMNGKGLYVRLESRESHVFFARVTVE